LLIFIDILSTILYVPDLTPVFWRFHMNKSGLIETLREETGLTKRKAEQVIDLFFDEMSEALSSGERVEIRGFCSIYVKDYRGYAGRNPRTGVPTQVPPKKLPFFRCGKKLKAMVDYKDS
jgi:integration host factor subunit beta